MNKLTFGKTFHQSMIFFFELPVCVYNIYFYKLWASPKMLVHVSADSDEEEYIYYPLLIYMEIID